MEKLLKKVVVAITILTLMVSNIGMAYGDTSSNKGEDRVLTEEITAGETEIEIDAPKGAFPSGSEFKVKKASLNKEEKKLIKKKSEGNVVKSYTFDIHVENEGEKTQPEKEVKLSFDMPEVKDKNLKARVFHIGEKVEELKVKEEESKLNVKTDSFSLYTVEFYYEDKEYVLEGGNYIKLSDLLDKVGIEGEVEKWEVSNHELFNIYKGDDNGVTYDYDIKVMGDEAYEFDSPIDNRDGNVLYLVSKKPFKTNEWLKVTIDGVEYKIDVTDDYIDYYGNIITLPNVVQGDTDDNFTDTMPIATIFIDEDVVNRSVTSRNNSEVQILYNGAGKDAFILKNTSYGGVDESTGAPIGYEGADNVTLSFDTSVRPLLAGQDNLFSGDVFRAKFVNGAAYIDPYSGDKTDYDLIITYKDMHINVDADSTGDKLNLISSNAVMLGHENGNMGRYRFGIKVDINIQVIDKQGNVVNGTFYYPMVDLDVYRGHQNYGGIYGADETYSNNYSEQVVINGGLAEGKIWIPGATGQRYKSLIEDNGTDGLLVSASPNLVTDDNTFYTGFATLVDNSNGLDMTYRASCPGNYFNGIETNLMSGKNRINWLLKSTTGVGGNIETTRYGNHNGKLNDGGQQYGPSTLTVATGQRVVYTMTPQKGYRLKEVKVNRTDAEIDHAGTSVITPTPHDTDGDGVPDYYTFEFSAINSNGAIHVEWEKTILSVTKKTSGSGDVPDIFTFEIKAWDPNDPTHVVDFSTEDSTRFSPVQGKADTYKFTLGNNETMNISSEIIPVGWKWHIEEVQVNGKYGTEDGWRPTSSPSKEGVLPGDDTTQHATFSNTRKKTSTSTNTLKIKKYWEDDVPELRPDKLTMELETVAPIGVPAIDFRTKIFNFVPRGSITGIKYGTKEGYENASVIDYIDATNGKGTVYFYKIGNDVYFYSDNEIYLTGSTFADSKGMFESCYNLTDISGLSKVHTEFVTSFENLFLDAYSITDFSALSDWNTANVTTMAKAFGANSPNTSGKEMKYTDISFAQDWQMQNVTNIRWMFRGAKGLSDISPIANWDTGRVTTTEQMFFRTSVSNTASAKAIESWNMRANTIFNNMFQNSSSNGQGLAIIANLPDWGNNAEYPRPGSWGTNGTYTPLTPYTNQPAEYGKNDEQAFWNSASPTKTVTDHDVDENNDNLWIYEVEVPVGSKWNVHEVIPEPYDSKYDTRGGLEGETMVDGKGLESNKIEAVSIDDSAEIHNKRKTKEVVLKVTWEDDNNIFGYRPLDMFGNIDYQVGTYNGVVSTINDWTVSGKVWEKTFKIPIEADVPDWGELLPPRYKMISKTHADGTNVYELVNTLTPVDLTISKNVTGSLGDRTKGFEFEVRLFDENLCSYCNGTGDVPCEHCNGTGAVESNYNLSTPLPEGVAGSNGVYNFKLKDDESIVIPNVPSGTKVIVTEKASDHVASYAIDGGASGSNVTKNTPLSTSTITMSENKSVSFTNNRETAVITGIKSMLAPAYFIMLILVAMLALSYKEIERIKKKKLLGRAE